MDTCMDYSRASQGILGENQFDSRFLGKCESVMCLGNGYLGIRSATEERYLGETRNFFVAGTFNKFDQGEVTELPNIPDILELELWFNDQKFTLEQGEIKEYDRCLNLRTGELVRRVTWVSPTGEEILLKFERIVSMKNLHVIAQRVSITAVDNDLSVKAVSGINGRVTNSGAQHFSEGNKRYYENKYMQSCLTTTESRIDFVVTTGLEFRCTENHTWESGPADGKPILSMERRYIFCTYSLAVPKGKTLVIEKISNVFTSRDKKQEHLSMEHLQNLSLQCAKEAFQKGYTVLAEESAAAWKETVWEAMPIQIESDDPLDQLALLFAQYHLHCMTPAHDNRMSIGAKGLSGEGYKGHTFWDTDIFILPYFTFTYPKTARSLEEYRYLTLDGAREKAAKNRLEGAQFPWESAWLDDGEVTPEWWCADIITGQPIKVWSGLIELHITADVAFGVWQYYMTTNDQEYMDRYGYEILMETAKFWASRLEWSEADGRYHINDVIGPDEYAEHSDDNAYTNYMASWNLKIAMQYCEELKKNNLSKYKELNEKLGLDHAYKVWKDRHSLIYLPKPRTEDGIIPMHREYMSYPSIDLTPYKESGDIFALYRDYSPSQVCKMQISKQADVLMLFWLMEDLFDAKVKKANWDFYEARTTHDSSLSLPPHVILANDLGEKELAYQLFQKAIRVDIGENMASSNEGIHAAALGGIWQMVVFGFGGVRRIGANLGMCPLLPKKWKNLEFSLWWHGQKLHISMDKEQVTVINETGTDTIHIQIWENWYELRDEITVSKRKEAKRWEKN